jgi:hypothetical protein
MTFNNGRVSVHSRQLNRQITNFAACTHQSRFTRYSVNRLEFSLYLLEATTGFEPVIRVLHSSRALWMRRVIPLMALLSPHSII